MKAFMFFTFVLMSFLDNGHRLENTTWVYQLSNNCKDHLELKAKRKALEYDCELGYQFKGTYRIIKDTLKVTLLDDAHSEDGGKTTSYINSYLIKSNALHFVGASRLEKGKWMFRKYNGKSEVIYTKIKRLSHFNGIGDLK